nr:uncharacterized protein LOC113827860 [Penaeus vannamei]
MLRLALSSQNRTFVSAVMASLVVHVTDSDLDMVDKVMHNSHGITRWSCYSAALDVFDKGCFRLAENPYALRVLQPIVNLCEHGYTAEQFARAVQAVCTHDPVRGMEHLTKQSNSPTDMIFDSMTVISNQVLKYKVWEYAWIGI